MWATLPFVARVALLLYINQFPYHRIAYEYSFFGERQVSVLLLEVAKRNLFFCSTLHESI